MATPIQVSVDPFGPIKRALGPLKAEALTRSLETAQRELRSICNNLAPKVTPQDLSACSAPATIAVEDRSNYGVERTLGSQAYAQDEVAIMILAGGRASRLKFDAPKGCYPIGPVSDRSLFQVFAEKARAIGLANGTKHPLLVFVTSSATHDETLRFFATHRFFGLDQSRVFFVQQSMVPSVDAEANQKDGSFRVAVDPQGAIIRNPNGHGGCLMAVIADQGVRSAFGNNHTKYLLSLQIDNPLALVFDPLSVGLCARVGVDMVTKVVQKTEPTEKVGLVVENGGTHMVVEYSEMPAEKMEQRWAGTGQLVFAAGNTAMHVFALDFLDRLRVLPYHLSAPKSANVFDPSTGGMRIGTVLQLEAFAFDALPQGNNICVAVTREEEFSPVKSADVPRGPIAADTPARARADLAMLQRRWLAEAGVEVEGDGMIEFDFSVAESADHLRRLLKEGKLKLPPGVRAGMKVTFTDSAQI
jgi:UDP-N-acetylglucosamine/UDP-N-acetylgalactosamine diphosphorylase